MQAGYDEEANFKVMDPDGSKRAMYPRPKNFPDCFAGAKTSVTQPAASTLRHKCVCNEHRCREAPFSLKDPETISEKVFHMQPERQGALCILHEACPVFFCSQPSP